MLSFRGTRRKPRAMWIKSVLSDIAPTDICGYWSAFTSGRLVPERHIRALDTELGNGYSTEAPAPWTVEGCAVTQPAYPAARAAALRVHPRYGQHTAKRRVEDEGTIGLLPDVETIEAIIDVAFWASLRREETYTPRFSLAFVEPAQVNLPLMFETPVPLASQPL